MGTPETNANSGAAIGNNRMSSNQRSVGLRTLRLRDEIDVLFGLHTLKLMQSFLSA
jgi:hypothetical protein